MTKGIVLVLLLRLHADRNQEYSLPTNGFEFRLKLQLQASVVREVIPEVERKPSSAAHEAANNLDDANEAIARI